MAQAAHEKWDRVDALVNNAGTTKFVDHDKLEGLSSEDFQRIYSVNVVGAYQMTRAVSPFMQGQEEGGAVVNVASTAESPASAAAWPTRLQRVPWLP